MPGGEYADPCPEIVPISLPGKCREYLLLDEGP